MSGCVPMALVHFDWQAAATFATGILAVGAAMYVGARQTRISKHQVNIYDLYTRNELILRDLEIRCKLLDRRIECIDKIREIMHEIMIHGVENFRRLPDLFDAIRKAEFLFHTNAIENLRKTARDVEQAERERWLSKACEDRNDENGRVKHQTLEFEATDRIWDALPTLINDLIAAARIELPTY